MRELYMEIIEFMTGCGGSYRVLDNDTCKEVIDALFNDRFRLVRSSDESIISFSTFWLIHEADLEQVKNGFRPDDITGGSIVYIADHAGKGAYPELIRYIKSSIGADKKGVCWHHRYRTPSNFRFYPNKEGDRVRQIHNLKKS